MKLRRLQHLQGVVSKLANRLQRRLMAQQSRSWDFDQEEGLLDAARLARVVVNPAHSLSYKVERDTEFRDTVVSLLIDNSGSMRYLLDKVIESARIIINSNKPGDETFLVRFISSDKIETLLDFTSDKQALSEALDNLYIEAGQTAVIDAVYLASERVSEYKRGDDDDRRRRALILITDGEDRSSFYNQNQLFRQLRESNVQIYVIGFVDELDREGSFIRKSPRERAINLINRLANETGGRAFFPKSINELPQIAEEITRDLRTQYVIGYSPTNKARDGSFRNVRVVVANGPGGEKRIAITRPGYYAPNEQSPNGNQPPRRPVANGVRTPPK